MKLSMFSAHLATLTDRPPSTFLEITRFLNTGSTHFDELKDSFRGGTGRGGGLDLTPFRAAFFVLAVACDFAATFPRREIVQHTYDTWLLNYGAAEGCTGGWAPFPGAPQMLPENCPVTGSPLFGPALEAILTNEDLARSVKEVRFSTGKWAVITFDDGRVSRFGEDEARASHARMSSAITLSGMFICELAAILTRAGVR